MFSGKSIIIMGVASRVVLGGGYGLQTWPVRAVCLFSGDPGFFTAKNSRTNDCTAFG